MWEPEGRWGGREEPSLESWRHSRKYLCTLQRQKSCRPWAPNCLLHPTLFLLGLSTSTPAPSARLLEGGPQAHAWHIWHPSATCRCFFQSPTLGAPCRNVAPLLSTQDKEGMCVVRNCVNLAEGGSCWVPGEACPLFLPLSPVLYHSSGKSVYSEVTREHKATSLRQSNYPISRNSARGGENPASLCPATLSTCLGRGTCRTRRGGGTTSVLSTHFLPSQGRKEAPLCSSSSWPWSLMRERRGGPQARGWAAGWDWLLS